MSMLKKFDVISIGSSLRDIFIVNRDMKLRASRVKDPFDPGVIGEKISLDKIYFDIGGGGSNTAATLANMGLKTGLISAVGDDLSGEEVIRVMKEFGVDTTLVQKIRGEETGYSVIFLDEGGDRTALVYRGASDTKHWQKLNPSKIDTDWFFITSLGGNLDLLREIFQLADKKNIKIAWNPGSQELAAGREKLKYFLRRVNILLLNKSEAKYLGNTKSEKINVIFERLEESATGAGICITGGKVGAWLKRDNTVYWAVGFDKPAKNATGAGDAFGSALLAGLLKTNGDVRKGLQLAILNSNGVVMEMGAKHGLLKKFPGTKVLNKVKVVEV